MAQVGMTGVQYLGQLYICNSMMQVMMTFPSDMTQEQCQSFLAAMA